MTSAVLEVIRGSHEDLETVEKTLAKLFMEKHQSAGKSTARQASCDSCLAYLIKHGQQTSRDLLNAYKDADGMKKDEVEMLGGKRADKPDGDVWMNFYDKIKETKDYHRRFGNARRTEFRTVDWFYERALEQDLSETLFSNEEDYGRRLDPHQFYTQFINLRKLKAHNMAIFKEKEKARIKSRAKASGKHFIVDDKNPDLLEAMKKYEDMGYIPWLKSFDQFHEIPRHCKYRDGEYTHFIQSLLEYLKGAIRRGQPLVDLGKIEKKCEKEFEERWAENKVEAWRTKTHQMDLFTLPTQRLFVTKATKEAHMNGKLYKKKVAEMQQMSMDEQKKLVEESIKMDKHLAFLEFQIQRFRDVCSDQITETIRNCEKKESMTAEELGAEQEQSDEESDGGVVVSDVEGAEDDEERPIYNPLNLPIGWDGKPIPFWLYKLHGMGQEFKCEICGNYSYWGRRAFEKHFSEWRHAFGMRCLKIPNTQHFKEITKIEDAVTLYDKLKKDAKEQTFDPEIDVECEDMQGNVMSQKAFDDLRRQGLV